MLIGTLPMLDNASMVQSSFNVSIYNAIFNTKLNIIQT